MFYAVRDRKGFVKHGIIVAVIYLIMTYEGVSR